MSTATKPTKQVDLSELVDTHLDRGSVIVDTDGTILGATYYDAATHCWYAADADDLRCLADTTAEHGEDAYSHWCSVTSADEFDTEVEARASLGGADIGSEKRLAALRTESSQERQDQPDDGRHDRQFVLQGYVHDEVQTSWQEGATRHHKTLGRVRRGGGATGKAHEGLQGNAPEEKGMTSQYICIPVSPYDTEFYPIDTDEQVAEARAALRTAGLKSAPVYHGDPESPDSYRDSVHILWALPDDGEG